MEDNVIELIDLTLDDSDDENELPVVELKPLGDDGEDDLSEEFQPKSEDDREEEETENAEAMEETGAEWREEDDESSIDYTDLPEDLDWEEFTDSALPGTQPFSPELGLGDSGSPDDVYSTQTFSPQIDRGDKSDDDSFKSMENDQKEHDRDRNNEESEISPSPLDDDQLHQDRTSGESVEYHSDNSEQDIFVRPSHIMSSYIYMYDSRTNKSGRAAPSRSSGTDDHNKHKSGKEVGGSESDEPRNASSSSTCRRLKTGPCKRDAEKNSNSKLKRKDNAKIGKQSQTEFGSEECSQVDPHTNTCLISLAKHNVNRKVSEDKLSKEIEPNGTKKKIQLKLKRGNKEIQGKCNKRKIVLKLKNETTHSKRRDENRNMNETNCGAENLNKDTSTSSQVTMKVVKDFVRKGESDTDRSDNESRLEMDENSNVITRNEISHSTGKEHNFSAVKKADSVKERLKSSNGSDIASGMKSSVCPLSTSQQHPKLIHVASSTPLRYDSGSSPRAKTKGVKNKNKYATKDKKSDKVGSHPPISTTCSLSRSPSSASSTPAMNTSRHGNASQASAPGKSHQKKRTNEETRSGVSDSNNSRPRKQSLTVPGIHNARSKSTVTESRIHKSGWLSPSETPAKNNSRKTSSKMDPNVKDKGKSCSLKNGHTMDKHEENNKSSQPASSSVSDTSLMDKRRSRGSVNRLSAPGTSQQKKSTNDKTDSAVSKSTNSQPRAQSLSLPGTHNNACSKTTATKNRMHRSWSLSPSTETPARNDSRKTSSKLDPNVKEHEEIGKFCSLENYPTSDKHEENKSSQLSASHSKLHPSGRDRSFNFQSRTIPNHEVNKKPATIAFRSKSESMVSDRKREQMHHGNRRQVVAMPDHLSSDDDVISFILSWDADWFQKETEKDSPVDFRNFRENRKAYCNHTRYQMAFLGFHLLEIFTKVNGSTCSEDVSTGKKIIEQTEHAQGTNRVQYEMNERLNLRKDDLVVAAVRTIGSDTPKQTFGLVVGTNSARTPNGLPKTNIAFHKTVVVPMEIKLNVVTSLKRELNAIRTVLSFDKSHLSPYLLSPSHYTRVYGGERNERNEMEFSDLVREGLNDIGEYTNALSRQSSACLEVGNEKSALIRLFEGPAGCGKTSLLAHLVARLAMQDTSSSGAEQTHRTLLACAPSNKALDELLKQIWRKILKRAPNAAAQKLLGNNVAGVKIVRVGKPSVTDKKLKRFLLPELVIDHREEEDVILREANIVGCTLEDCGDPIVQNALEKRIFAIFVDDACHCTETEILPALQCQAEILFMAGDQKQGIVPVRSKDSRERNFEWSIMERIGKDCDGEDIIYHWSKQYRMKTEVGKFPFSYFYRDSSETREDLFPSDWQSFHLHPYLVFDVTNESLPNDQRFAEAEFIAALLKTVEGGRPQKTVSVGVITQDAEQKELLKKKLSKTTNAFIGTLTEFYGWQKDVIVLSASCTVDNRKSDCAGFLGNPRKLCLALTRARQSLIIVGNQHKLQQINACWNSLLQDAKTRGVIHSTSKERYSQDARRCLREPDAVVSKNLATRDSVSSVRSSGTKSSTVPTKRDNDEPSFIDRLCEDMAPPVRESTVASRNSTADDGDVHTYPAVKASTETSETHPSMKTNSPHSPPRDPRSRFSDDRAMPHSGKPRFSGKTGTSNSPPEITREKESSRRDLQREYAQRLTRRENHDGKRVFGGERANVAIVEPSRMVIVKSSERTESSSGERPRQRSPAISRQSSAGSMYYPAGRRKRSSYSTDDATLGSRIKRAYFNGNEDGDLVRSEVQWDNAYKPMISHKEMWERQCSLPHAMSNSSNGWYGSSSVRVRGMQRARACDVSDQRQIQDDTRYDRSEMPQGQYTHRGEQTFGQDDRYEVLASGSHEYEEMESRLNVSSVDGSRAFRNTVPMPPHCGRKRGGKNARRGGRSWTGGKRGQGTRRHAPYASHKSSAGKCYRCGAADHRKKDCPSAILCYACQEYGHIAIGCPNKWKR